MIFLKKAGRNYMNKKKVVKKSILVATFGILALCLMPSTMAGPPAFMQERNWWENLAMPFFAGDWDWDNPPHEYQYAFWPFNSSWDIHFFIGWAAWWEEFENDWAPKWPYQFKLWINDEQIPLQRYTNPVPEENKEIVAKVSFWYHFFGPGYFEVGGEYILRWEFWVRRPYQGDGKNYWRVFVDYAGFLSPPGSVFSFEFPLIFVV